MEESYRPRALRVMAEFVDDDPVWDGDVEHMGPVVLDELGVSPALVRRLRSWNERYGRVSSVEATSGGREERETWVREGLSLAYALQDELPDVEVSYFEDGDRRPVRERRGP